MVKVYMYNIRFLNSFYLINILFSIYYVLGISEIVVNIRK